MPVQKHSYLGWIFSMMFLIGCLGVTRQVVLAEDYETLFSPSRSDRVPDQDSHLQSLTGLDNHLSAEILPQESPEETIQLSIESIPPLPGLQFTIDGVPFQSGEDGVARIEVGEPGIYQLEVHPYQAQDDAFKAVFARWGDGVFTPQRPVALYEGIALQVGYDIHRLVQLDFIGLEGDPFPAQRVSTVEIRNSLGDITDLPGAEAVWLQAGKVYGRDYGLELVDVVQTVQRVMVDGSNVVNRGQQRFVVSPAVNPRVEVLLYPAVFSARDAFFGFKVGRGISLEYPDGNRQFFPFENEKTLQLESLARGTYRFQAVGAPGIALETVFVLSREQQVSSVVISIWDLALVLVLGLIIFPGILFAGRPRVYKRFKETIKEKLDGFRKIQVWMIVFVLISMVFAIPSQSTALALDSYQENPIPLLAYYYIWYDRGSWERAKSDLPMVGTYSSDEEQVLRQHVKWAQMAGIDGFIVSWKSNGRLNSRLETLVKIAADEGFKLAIIYQGLDFEREPLPVETVFRDLEYFKTNYSENSVFSLFEKPLVIWSGTWEFTRDEIQQVTEALRDDLLILASERYTDTYLEIADLVDGDAYYWSSVDPNGTPGYQEKLKEMSRVIHERGGLWIAPAAPGFDARLIEGYRVVERNDGDTLIKQLNAAYASSPDAVGLISWNEFSENSHIEPSENYGMRALEVLADYQEIEMPEIITFASSQPLEDTFERNYGWTISLGIMGVLVVLSLVIIIRRGSKMT